MIVSLRNWENKDVADSGIGKIPRFKKNFVNGSQVAVQMPLSLYRR